MVKQKEINDGGGVRPYITKEFVFQKNLIFVWFLILTKIFFLL